MFTLVLGQVPRILEGPLAVRAVERPLARVGELVSFNVGRAGECLAACFAGVGLWSDLRLRLRRGGGVLLAVRLLSGALPRAALGEKFNGGEDLVRAGRGQRQLGSGEGPVHVRAYGPHVEVRWAVFVRDVERTLRAGKDDRRHLV